MNHTRDLVSGSSQCRKGANSPPAGDSLSKEVRLCLYNEVLGTTCFVQWRIHLNDPSIYTLSFPVERFTEVPAHCVRLLRKPETSAVRPGYSPGYGTCLLFLDYSRAAKKEANINGI